MESYLDTIKEYAQKLVAAGSPLDEEDLIFHTLKGLPKAFNGFKTAIRTRGSDLTFAELVNMLGGEDLQLIQEGSTENGNASVLVATHAPQTNPNHASGSTSTTSSLPYGVSPQSFSASQFGYPNQFGATSQFGYPNQFGYIGQYGQVPPAQLMPQLGTSFPPQFMPQFGIPTQFSAPSSQFMAQQFVPNSFRGFSRGRGRGPRLPCDICGRNNHSTNYCYYRPPNINFSPQQYQWRGSGSSASWGSPFSSSTGLPMFQPQQMSSPRVPMSPTPSSGSSSGPAQANFAGITDAFSAMNMHPSFNASSSPNPNNISSPSVLYGGHSPSLGQTSLTSPQTHPWYFDSGATNHITNNIQNLTNPQPAAVHEGIMVGNGTNLQVSHTGKGQEYPQDSVQGTMSQGSLPHSELF